MANAIAKVKHANQHGEKPRVRLNGGPFVDAATLDRLTVWNAQGVSYGALIDRLVYHAFSTGFDPVFSNPLAKQTRSEFPIHPKKKTAPAKPKRSQSLTPSPRWTEPV